MKFKVFKDYIFKQDTRIQLFSVLVNNFGADVLVEKDDYLELQGSCVLYVHINLQSNAKLTL